MVENLAFELQFPQFPFILSASIISWVTDSKKRRGFDGSKPTVRYHKESSSNLILTWHGPKGRVSHCPEASRFGISWSTGRGKQTSFYFHISHNRGEGNAGRAGVMFSFLRKIQPYFKGKISCCKDASWGFKSNQIIMVVSFTSNEVPPQVSVLSTEFKKLHDISLN